MAADNGFYGNQFGNDYGYTDFRSLPLSDMTQYPSSSYPITAVPPHSSSPSYDRGQVPSQPATKNADQSTLVDSVHNKEEKQPKAVVKDDKEKNLNQISTKNEGSKIRETRDKKERNSFDRQMLKFEDSMIILEESIDKFKILQDIKTHIINEEEPDFKFIVEGIKEIVSALKSANKSLDAIAEESKKTSSGERAHIQKEVSAIFSKYSKSFEHIVSAIQDIETNQATLSIPSVKRFFYLADGSQKDSVLKDTPDDFHTFIEKQAIDISTDTAQNIFLITKEWNELNDSFKKNFTELFPQKRRRR